MTRKAELTRRLQSHRLSQFRLMLVEGPKSFGFQFQGARDVEAVESACSETWSVLTGEIGANVEG